ncbi:alkene reductase [Streptomyces sp. enrichment culture]|uniref:alkene reductase n=1 Tax=Streptomyces sp. enrichment culture TaxID=1795815 RepID=UPI003F57C14B
MTTAFDAMDLGQRRLANRIAMAPMTRSRAYGAGAAPTEAMATYYAQRAEAGLIITEGTQSSVMGPSHPDSPGLHTTQQAEAWAKVTDAVHRRGGTIFAQLTHAGRVTHPSVLPDDLAPLGPSAVAANGWVHTRDGPRAFVTPREMDEEDIRQTVADFATAARNAVAAGFDGVEIDGANGYLVHQFLADNTNLRTDDWGGDTAGRIRLAVEIVTAVADAIGGHRVGLRVSPGSTSNHISESRQREIYGALVSALNPLRTAYLHLVESPDRALTRKLRKEWDSAFILNPYTAPEPTGPESLALVEDGTADIISFGALFLANPDLPRRLALGGPFNSPEQATFYGGDERGYTDYPYLA